MQRYQFSEENKKYLSQFLQVAKSTRSDKYCDVEEHRILSKFVPLDIDLSKDLNSIIKDCDIIDITESDEETDNNLDNIQICVSETLDSSLQSQNNSNVDDILYLIKESLQVEKYIPLSILNDLNETKCDQHKIFELLSEELNCEEIVHFGDSLKIASISNDSVVSLYIRHILLKRLNLEYSDQLQELLNDLSLKFSEIVLEELTQTIIHNKSYSKVFLQFCDGLNVDRKQKLFRKLISSCGKLDEKYIPVIELLTTAQVEVETLGKFFEIVSSGDGSFSADKSFGKLLMNIMQLLGKNILQLEQPLRHIIGSHRSIWKSKLQKKFDDCLQQSSMLSQSIRY